MTLQERIEAFLDSSVSLLADLQAEDFERHRQALIAAKLQQCHSLLDESDRHWEQIQTRRYVSTGEHSSNTYKFPVFISSSLLACKSDSACSDEDSVATAGQYMNLSE